MAIDHRYTQVMLERVLSQNELILEILGPMAKDVRQLKEDMAEMKKTTQLHKWMLEAHEKDLKDHGVRIEALEAA